eukprot:3758017-Prymnesium_polylepis.1
MPLGKRKLAPRRSRSTSRPCARIATKWTRSSRSAAHAERSRASESGPPSPIRSTARPSRFSRVPGSTCTAWCQQRPK